MKHSLIAGFLLLTALQINAQNEIDTKYLVNSWKIVSLGEKPLPSEDFLMIFKFTAEGVLTIGSNYSVQAFNYKLEDNIISISSENEEEEKWEIKKLTSEEFVFLEEKTGEIKLVITAEDLPAVVTPIEEPEIEEPIANSIETDYKPTKKTKKLLIGTWSVTRIGNIDAPKGMSLEITLSKEGKVNMLSNAENNVSGNWKLSEDKKKINISIELNDEVWGIKTVDKKNLIILDETSGEIVMKRATKAKK
jgi:hypothetical protein